MRNYYHSKRDLLLHTIYNSPLAAYATISEENAGLHFLLKLKTNLSDKEFLQRMKHSGIKLSSLSQYYQVPPEAAEHIFIINYSFVAEENLEKAIQMIYRALF